MADAPSSVVLAWIRRVSALALALGSSIKQKLEMDQTLSSPMNKLTIEFNGQTFEVPPGTTIEQLLVLAEIRSRLVAVEVNQEIVPRALHSTHCVSAGDTVEAVTLVGGG